VVHHYHDTTTAGHPGAASTLLAIAKDYWWPKMKDFIHAYVKGCATCQMTKANTHPNRPPLSLITPDPNAVPFLTVSVDWVTKLPLSEGYDSILTITNHNCSKAVVLLPCKETMTSKELAELYVERVFPHYRLPDKVISDCDPRINSDLFQDLCATIGIKQNISSAYHPQTDGQSERTNQSMEAVLQTLCNC
jgi:hypothetical protein